MSALEGKSIARLRVVLVDGMATVELMGGESGSLDSPDSVANSHVLAEGEALEVSVHLGGFKVAVESVELKTLIAQGKIDPSKVATRISEPKLIFGFTPSTVEAR